MSDIVWHHHAIDKAARMQRLDQRPCLVWFTGLSGSGKSTIAGAVEQHLFEHGHLSYLLDGDNIRHGLNKDLGFSDRDRVENIRRIGEVGKLMVDAGLITLAAFISPFRTDRHLVRGLSEVGDFIEVHVDAPLDVCEARDPKGLYKRARAGEIKQFTGIDSPYEAPEEPELHLDVGTLSVEQSTAKVVKLLAELNHIKIAAAD